MSILFEGIEFSGSRCEVWTRAILAWIADSGSQCLKFLGMIGMYWGLYSQFIWERWVFMGYSWVFYPRNYDHSARYFQSMLCHYFADLRLEFAPIDGADRACRGSSATDNNPAHYRVVSGRYKIQAKTSLDPSSTHKNRVLLLKTPELLCICWVFGGSIGLFLLIKASKPMNISCNRAL